MFFQIKLFLVISILTTIQALQCPPSEEIFPCTCLGYIETLSCQGPLVTQQAIDLTFEATRRVNNLTADDLLGPITTLYILKTELTSLDLTSILNSRFADFICDANYNLSSITGPQPVELHLGKIKATWAFIQYNLLTNEGLGDSLKYFSDQMRGLVLSENEIQGGAFDLNDGTHDIEFLPGLSRFVNLQDLTLSHNPIPILAGGQFKRNVKLSYLSLPFNKVPISIGPNAFLLGEPDLNFVNKTLRIPFWSNGVTSEDFHPGNLVDYNTRPFDLDLSFEEMTDFNQEFFEIFLNHHDRNLLSFYSNPLVCGSQMKWLKDQRERFEKRVYGCDCKNDPGFTCFTSNLI